MKTPEQIAREAIRYPYPSSPIGIELIRYAVAAINADRAQFFDTAGSASRQHYIDTGRYMLHEEVAEMERINGR